MTLVGQCRCSDRCRRLMLADQEVLVLLQLGHRHAVAWSKSPDEADSSRRSSSEHRRVLLVAYDARSILRPFRNSLSLLGTVA